MERQQIEVFLTLAEELHFARTAERLRLSQARVSQSVKTSEAEVGAQLFARTSRHVALTPVGQRLRDALAPAYADVLAAIAEASALAQEVTRVVSVGYLGPLCCDLLTLAVTRLRQRYPDCAVNLRATEIDDPTRPLRDGDVDVLLTQQPVREPGIVNEAPAIVEARVLAIAAEHPLARRESVSLEDLAGERVFRPSGSPSRDWERSYQPWTTPSGRPLERGESVATLGELLSMVAAGRGICTVGAHNQTYHPRPGVAYVPIVDAPPFEFGFVRRSDAQSRLVQTLVSTVAGLVDDLGGPANVSASILAAAAGSTRGSARR